MKTSNHVNRNPSQKKPVQKKKSGGGTLVGIFVGLVVGLAIAFGVVWYLNKSPLPFQNKDAAPRADKPAPPAPGSPAAAAQAPAPLPGKPGDKPTDRSADKQRFEFYGILEGKQQATPGAKPAAGAPGTPAAAVPPAPTSSVPAAADAKSAEIFFLQAGAFQKAADADNLKAKLALTGLETNVQEVNIPDKGTMHRVRVGPFKSPEEMNRARTVLSQSGVQASVVKQKD